MCQLTTPEYLTLMNRLPEKFREILETKLFEIDTISSKVLLDYVRECLVKRDTYSGWCDHSEKPAACHANTTRQYLARVMPVEDESTSSTTSKQSELKNEQANPRCAQSSRKSTPRNQSRSSC